MLSAIAIRKVFEKLKPNALEIEMCTKQKKRKVKFIVGKSIIPQQYTK
jgi:hypothetical protein